MSVCYRYRPPNAGIKILHDLNSFQKFAFDSKYKDFILLGDLNFPSIQWLNGSGFSDLSNENGFIAVNSATRGQNTIVLVLTNIDNIVNEIVVCTCGDSVSLKSDHEIITLDVYLKRKSKLLTKRLVYNYKKGDFDSLGATLRSLPLSDIVLGENEIASAWAKWKDSCSVDIYILKGFIKRSYKPPYTLQAISSMP